VPTSTPGPAGAPSPVGVVVAHVSDTHFGHERAEAADRARRVLDAILQMDPRPDILVHTGDVADHGLPHEYAEALEVLSAWDGPLAVSPGNHDVRGHYVEAFLGGAPGASRGWANRSHSVAGARFLMLDSLVDELDGVRQDHGEVAVEQLAWLDAELSWDARPTFVCLHHPPVSIGVGLMDPIMLSDAGSLAEVIGRHSHVAATLVGHAHTMGVSTFAGRPLLVGGGVVSTVPLDQEERPVVWYDAAPTFAVHFLHDDGRVTTHWRAV
jgi:3',5'-cyclic-AMP phosphodiesterase